MKRSLASLRRLSTVAAASAALVLGAGCTTNNAAESARIRDLAFWCHDHMGIAEVHSPAMNNCIRQNWDRDIMETTTANQ